MGPTESASQTFQFDEYSFDPHSREIVRNGRKLRLAPQPARVLEILIHHAGKLVTREEFVQQVWGSETYVDFEGGLNHAIRQIRECLEDSAEQPHYVETLPKAGYRFIAPVYAAKSLDVQTNRDSFSAHGLPDKDLIVLEDLANNTGESVFDNTLKAVDKDQGLRYRTAVGLVGDLNRLERDTSSARRGAAVSVVAGAKHGRDALATLRGLATKRWWLAAVGLLLVGLFTCGYFYFHRAPTLTEKDTIILADFTNTTGDSVFEGALRQGLEVQLEQSPFLSLVSEARIRQTLHMMGQPTGARLTPEVAEELCQRTESAAVLNGSIASLGGQYVLGLKAVNCRTGDTLAEEQATADGKEQVLKALGKAAANLRSRLRESLRTVQKFQTINVPGAFSSSAEGVNDQGAVVGNFTTSVEGLPQSFLLFQGNFSFFTFPGSVSTTTRDINNHSQITGSFVDNRGLEHGFMVLNGNFEQIDVPFPNKGTLGAGINNNDPGDMVGFFRDPNTGRSISFLRQRNGTFTQFTFPGSVSTEASGINVNSIIVGTYQLGDGVNHGFRVRNGVFITVDFPGAVHTAPHNINDKNEIVGQYTLPDGSMHGFSLDLKTNTFTTIDRPATIATAMNGVNNNDQVAGWNEAFRATTAFQADCMGVF